MQKYLFVGDLHGDLNDAERAIILAYDHKATIIQVGDWGFLWPQHNQVEDLHRLLDTYSVKMLFIDGNHDWHSKLAKFENTPELTYLPRGSVYTDSDGTNFLSLGGAPSLDRGSRIENVSWWPEECITDLDVDKALAHTCKIDVMVTHDSPVMPYGFTDQIGWAWFRVAGPDSRARLARVAMQHKPKLVVHGHWHVRYTREWNGIKIEGLSAGFSNLSEFCLPWENLTSSNEHTKPL